MLVWDPLLLFPGILELAFQRLPIWQILSEEWFRRCILTTLESDSLTSCCSICNLICISLSSMQLHFAATDRMFLVGLQSCSFCLSKESCFFKASETFFEDLLEGNRLKASLWHGTSSRNSSMYLIVTSAWYWYSAIMWQYRKPLAPNRVSVMGIH